MGIAEYKALSSAKGKEQKILRDAKAGMSKKKSPSNNKKTKKKQTKILKKPKAKGIQPLSAVHAIRGLADAQGALVREVEKKEIVRDDRSQFFNRELNSEIKQEKKWLS